MAKTNVIMNQELNGVEIYFEDKPEKSIIASLKANGFHYHGTKVCWYAKQNIKTIREAQKYSEFQDAQNFITESLPTVPTSKANIKNALSLWDLTQWTEIDNVTGKNLTTKEIAAEVRKLARTRFSFCKFSITSTYSSISFHIVSSPFEKDSVYLKAIQEYCTNLLKSYKYCTCDDPYGDYGSSYNFYGSSASIDYGYKQTEQTEAIKEDILDFDAKKAQSEKAEEEQKEIDFQAYLVKQEQEKADHKIRQTKEAEQVQNIYNNISITELSGDQQYFVIGSQFAKLNGNSALEQYQSEVLKGEFETQTVKIQKEIHFQTKEAFTNFSNMLLNDFDFLKETGGSYTDDIRINSMTDYDQLTEEEQATIIFNLYGVAIFYNNELQFIVDTQGYNYARYVGLVDNVTIKKSNPVTQLINHDQIAELKVKADALEDYSVTVITDNDLMNLWHSEKWNEYKDLIKIQLSKNNFKLTKEIIQQLSEGTLKSCMYRLLKEVDGIQEQFKNANLQQGQKVTLFYISDWGSIVDQQITLDSVEYTKYAQYDKSVKLTFTPKGKRKKYYNFFHSTLLVYNGWLELPKDVLHSVEETSDFTITKTKFLSCDKGQYDAIMEHYEVQGLKPVINTYKPNL